MRLLRGDFAAETVYDDDPVALARRFEAAGAVWIHVVDLDGARRGAAGNREVIAELCASVTCPVQVGGGVRDAATADALLALGASRVVVGTAAVETPELVDELADRRPGRVAVGLDARGDEVAVRGWTEGAGTHVEELARRFSRPGVGAVIVTQIERDGTLDGPDVDQLARVLDVCLVPVIASGGVGTLADLGVLARVTANGRELAGVITGRALYEGRFTIEEARAVLSE